MLRGRGGCYKHAFYGIESHRCMEATPSLACANKVVSKKLIKNKLAFGFLVVLNSDALCDVLRHLVFRLHPLLARLQCVFCWRHHTNPVGTSWKWDMDPPEQIVEQAVAQVGAGAGAGAGGGPGRGWVDGCGAATGRLLALGGLPALCAWVPRSGAAHRQLLPQLAAGRTPACHPPPHHHRPCPPPLQHVAMVKEYSGVPGVLPERLAEGYQVGRRHLAAAAAPCLQPRQRCPPPLPRIGSAARPP
jgi:hypothetical protein